MPRRPNYEPTPAEIAEGTAEIREEWDLAEHRRRAGMLAPLPWEVPLVDVAAQDHACGPADEWDD